MTRFRFLNTLAVLSLMLAFLPAQPARAAGTIFVDADSTCLASCGGSWATAYRELQTALSAAGSGAQVWVSEGVYYPGTVDRASTFILKNNIAVYGGFDGTETLLTQRDIPAHPTILSGDIDQNDTNTDGNHIAETTADIVGNNSYHVVTGGGTNNTAVLDGFIITAGLANGSAPNNSGAGMYNSSGSPTLRNLNFSGNRADNVGGGMYNNNSNPTLTDITFNSNSTTNNGGGMYNFLSSPTLTNITFNGNRAANSGGGMRNNNGNPALTNVTFNDNSADTGGGMNNLTSNPTLTNVTFSGNSAAINGGGMYNYNSSPTLTNVTFSDNSAANVGGGIYNYSFTSITLSNTLIANSTSGGDCFNDAGGSLNAASSNNLVEDSANACGLTNGVNGDIVGLDPNLSPLADNGGTTQTHALLAGSPAIDTGDDVSCPEADQRGIVRPQGAHCDIGAYEFEMNVMIFHSVGNYDGWVLESAENSNKGGTLDKTATTFRLGDDEEDKQYRAILHFNTESLPDTAVITKVMLKIKKQGQIGTNPFNIFGGLKVDMRRPYFGTKVNLMIRDFQAAAGKDSVATFDAKPVSNWYSAVLNATGRAYINLTGTTQFRLRFAIGDNDDNGADIMKFFSGDTATASARPTLIVEYYVP